MAFETIDPRDPEVRTALGRYLAEVARRVASTAISTDEIEDVAGYAPPGGVFLVGRVDGPVVACGAIRRLGPDLGEIKRMWIDPQWRGQGHGASLIAALEAAARELGYSRLRLDTSELLVEAVRLYESCGYRRIDRYNDNPDATLFYEKYLP